MSKTISLEQLPRKAERLLRAAWEEQESVVLERNGQPLAAVVPMEAYRRLFPDAEKADGAVACNRRRRKAKETKEPPVSPFAYDLPADVLAAYHRLVSKKFTEGLTPEEEAEMERLGAELDAADAATPLEQAAWKEHERRMAMLDELIAKRKALQELR
jgi:hypothetical protein